MLETITLQIEKKWVDIAPSIAPYISTEAMDEARRNFKKMQFKQIVLEVKHENYSGLYSILKSARDYVGTQFNSNGKSDFESMRTKQKCFDAMMKLNLQDLKRSNLRSACERLLKFVQTRTDKERGYIILAPPTSEINDPLLKRFTRFLDLKENQDNFHLVQLKGKTKVLNSLFKNKSTANQKAFTQLLFRFAVALENYNYIFHILKTTPTSCDSSVVEGLMFLGIESKDKDLISTCAKYFEDYENKHPSLKIANQVLQRLERIESLVSDSDIDVEAINDISGREFETVVINAFKKVGFIAEETPVNGDYGADIILITPAETRIAVQCKRFKSKVNLKAVQEVLGAVGHYTCDYALVITNNTYLNSAKKLAESNDVELWGSDELLKLLSEDISFSEVSNL